MKHLHYTSLDSTQDEILNHLESNLDEDYFLLSSDQQTNGRGRHQRVWDQTPSGLFLSMIIPPANTITLSTLEISLLICEYFNQNLKVKWPNDIYTEDLKKCAGVLVDVKQEKLIAGIGINTKSNQSYGHIKLKSSLTSKELAYNLAQYISQNRASDSVIIDNWNELCLHLNKDVEIQDFDQSYIGKFQGIGLNGQAILKMNNKVKEFYSGSLKLIS